MLELLQDSTHVLVAELRNSVRLIAHRLVSELGSTMELTSLCGTTVLIVLRLWP